ncbi:hypothetical protein JOD31_003011 [Methylopila capsulata]|uniref:DUF2063 domain-containing protein n=1 Tax=Methylopila capsulata TaxID=61654 RepID=A0A9W6IXB8_9HYPH|nr:DNA-binding domain-containing protein [Methylopila capsulata]MBM7852769.1 hypothetical protein [Methylopila capsulata]GLK56979.1 DUF2063 domain-containing protein [Methylopila capsulata]
MSAAAQARFAAAALDPHAAPPPDLAAAGGLRPERRFAVYRNNVAVGLGGALAARFPAVRRIVGDAFFAELARGFIHAHPPRSTLMMVYGEAFPEFIAAAPDLAELPYLGDVARLEAARTRAYHAADAVPLVADAFAAVPPETLPELGLRLHPSVGVVRSPHPVVSIWAMNADEAELGPIAGLLAEDGLVTRPELEVHVRRLPRGGAAFLAALGSGRALGRACAIARRVAPDFDLTLNLSGLIAAGLVATIDPPPNPELQP